MQFDKALNFVKSEKAEFDNAWVDLHEQLRKARRNYEMQYDQPIDVATGKRKMFVPLIRQEVNLIAPRFDLDPEAIHIKSDEPGLQRKAIIWQELLRHQFKAMDWTSRTKHAFPQWVNEGEMVIEMFWDSEKDEPNFATYDIKDVLIFPKEQDFWTASSFAVRKYILMSDFRKSKRYENKDDVRGKELVQDATSNSAGTMKYEIGISSYETELEWVELYERHGWFPKSFLKETSEEGDENDLVDGTITVANIDGQSVVVEISKESRRRNFIEAPYIKMEYRWLGQGVGIGLQDYQSYYNKLWNRRDDNEDILHRGMFLKRRGTNIDATQRTTGSGLFIETDDMAGLQQLPVNDITLNSYTGEHNLLANVQRLDGTEEVLRGGDKARSATGATINDRNANQRLAIPQTNLNRLFQKAVTRVMELDKQFLPKDKVVKIVGKDDELAVFDDFKLSEVNSAREQEGLPPISKTEMTEAMKKFNGERFVAISNIKLLSGDFEAEIDIDTSLIKNKAGQSQFLLDALGIAAQIPGVAEETINLC
jgi:hypothetical protein